MFGLKIKISLNDLNLSSLQEGIVGQICAIYVFYNARLTVDSYSLMLK